MTLVFWLRIWDQMKEFPVSRRIAAIAWCEGAAFGGITAWLVAYLLIGR